MSDILHDLSGGVLTLTFNRLDKKNSLTSAMYQVLQQALDTAASDDAVRVVVLQGLSLIHI
mgnify:FL=1